MTEILLGDIPDHQASRKAADDVAIRYGADTLSWAGLAERSLRRAHALSSAGVRQGDFVLIALPNAVAVHELTFAAWRLGAVPAMVSSKLPPAEFTAIAELMAPRIVIADPALATGAHPADFGVDHPDSSPLASKESPHWKAMTSGGSTGRPKVIVDHHSSRMTLGAPMQRMPEDGVMMNPGPLYHNLPFAMSHMALVHGTSVVGMDKFDAEECLSLIDSHKVQWISMVPTMMLRISRLPAAVRGNYDVSSLETLWHSAAPIAPWLKEEWIHWLGPEKIWEMYGGSEGFGLTVINGTEWLDHRGSVGRSVMGELMIAGEDGDALPTGEVGEIFMRAPGATKPNYHYLGAKSRRRDDGFESFGDHGWLDDDGFLYIADRRTDMIVCGGANIYPAEVEAALMAHPGVACAVVIVLPDEELGAVPHAIIEGEAGAALPSESELRAFAEEQLARAKTPRSYAFTDQPLRDEAGKVRRTQLRDERIANMKEKAI